MRCDTNLLLLDGLLVVRKLVEDRGEGGKEKVWRSGERGGRAGSQGERELEGCFRHPCVT